MATRWNMGLWDEGEYVGLPELFQNPYRKSNFSEIFQKGLT
jgi:hypothetical protein